MTPAAASVATISTKGFRTTEASPELAVAAVKKNKKKQG